MLVLACRLVVTAAALLVAVQPVSAKSMISPATIATTTTTTTTTITTSITRNNSQQQAVGQMNASGHRLEVAQANLIEPPLTATTFTTTSTLNPRHDTQNHSPIRQTSRDWPNPESDPTIEQQPEFTATTTITTTTKTLSSSSMAHIESAQIRGMGPSQPPGANRANHLHHNHHQTPPNEPVFDPSDLQQQQQQQPLPLSNNFPTDPNAPDVANPNEPFVFYDTPYTRRQLTKYILNEFHDIDLSGVLDTSPSMIELNRRDVFNAVSSEALIETSASNYSTGGGLQMGVRGNSTNRPFFGEVFESFNSAYWPIHCVICIVICTLGIFANLINVIVLTRPNMITAVNTILCAIACSDLIVNLSTIPYLFHELSDNSSPSDYYSHGWAHYILVHAHLSVTAHTISIWLTCALATWRYCVIRSQSSNKRNWSVRLAVRVILSVVLAVPVFCIPNYLTFDIVRDQHGSAPPIWRVGFSERANSSKIIKTFHFWIFSCLTKLLPCLLLTYFTTVLIKLLSSARERRLRLTNNLARNSNGNAQGDTKGFTPNGFKPGDCRMDSDEAARRRASDEQINRRRASGNGTKPAPLAAAATTATRANQANANQAAGGANGFELRPTPVSKVGQRAASEEGGRQSNLRLLARDMSMQMNVIVIKDSSSSGDGGQVAHWRGDKQNGQSQDDDDDGGGGGGDGDGGGGDDDDDVGSNGGCCRDDFGALEGGQARLEETANFNERDRDNSGASLAPQPLQPPRGAIDERRYNHERLGPFMEVRDSAAITRHNGPANNTSSSNTEIDDRAVKLPNNLVSHMTPHSGSSCATDAECLQVTASASSEFSAGSNTIDSQLTHLHHHHHHQSQHHKQQQQQQQQTHPHSHTHSPHLTQQLLVETIPAASAATTTRALVLNSCDERTNLLSSGNANGGDNKGHKLTITLNSTPRSASTCGALELYAIDNNNGGAPESRVTLANSGQQQHHQQQQQQQQQQQSSELHEDDLSKTNNQPSMVPFFRRNLPARVQGKLGLSAKRSGSATLHNANSIQGDDLKAKMNQGIGGGSAELRFGMANDGTTMATTTTAANRPRSIGSASFAPLQIVRLQATQRQLSQNETTTRLLIAVIIVFLICEFPAGILAALCAIFGQDFFENVYEPMGTFTDLLALINSSVNFILYCFMSTQFRVTFYRVVLHCPAPRELN